MGFTDLVSDAGLTGELLSCQSHAPGLLLTNSAVLNNFLQTRSYIAGYVFRRFPISQDLACLS